MNNYFLPTSLWGLAAGMSLLFVLLACGIYFWYRSRIKAAVKDSDDVAELAAEKSRLEAEIDQCDNWLNNNREELLKRDAEREEQERVRQELANFQIQAAEEQQKVDDLRKETNDLQTVVNVLAQDRDKLVQEKELLEKEKRDSEEARFAMREIIEKHKEEKDKFKDLLQSIAQNEIKQQALIGEISAREERVKEAEQQLSDVLDKLNQAKADLKPLEEVLAEKERAREDRDVFIREKAELNETVQNLKREKNILEERVDRLREISGTDADAHKIYADLLETEPECLSPAMFSGGAAGTYDEREALLKLQELLKNDGIFFSDRTIKAFHTSLKINDINPITVLAGVSGTGKTLLPIKYAEVMGMHNLVVSVQPRWDSPQDLFGFYNYLEHKYKATDMARALVRMDMYNFENLKTLIKKSDRMLLILLDEMNLARIEYYFSEFLSKLELRRGINDVKNTAERSLAEITLEMGPRIFADNISRLYVGGNVLFAGTMNEDESTQTLSDKVLDRANVLRFGKPPENITTLISNTRISQKKYLLFEQWNNVIKKDILGGNQWENDVTRWINSINSSLDKIGRPFGHRVQQAMRIYVANYPGVEDGSTHKTAFADQVEQKVIPKLRGIDMSEHNSRNALEEIVTLTEELGDTKLYEAFSKSKDDSSIGTFGWRGVTRPIER